MDQHYGESEQIDGADSIAESEVEFDAHTETFYVALKLALARLKEYSATSVG